MRSMRWLLIAAFVAGCKAPQPGGESESTPSAGPGDEPSQTGRVIVYSPHGPDVLQDYEKRFEAAYPGVDMQYLDMGSQEVYQRVQGERRNPQADVWWGAPSTMFMRAAEQGLLEPYRPSWADRIGHDARDPEDRWYGVYRSPLAIVFNNRRLTKETAPQTWDELLEPQWHGKITIRKPPPSGTMRTFIGAMILRAPSEDDGIAWLRKLHDATEAYMENPQFLYDHMKRREELVSVWLMPDVALQRQRNGYPLDCVVPRQTPVLMEGIAIIKGAPNPESAKTFYEFVTSSDELAHQAHAYSKVPTRGDLDPATLPDWIASQRIDAMDIDWQEFAKHEKRWCDRWEQEVYHAR